MTRCPKCDEPTMAHRDGACPDVTLAEVLAQLDRDDEGLEPGQLGETFVELITLRHAAEIGNETDVEAFVDRLADFPSIDLAVLLETSLGVVYGFLGGVAEQDNRTVEEVIQAIGLSLAKESAN